ncbi:hypothetical protein [Yinghuangia sp. YIM S10712]|uniref:hypothetical protein n=1 Tax=Yinghuangia sp. YIM S10712 TaxID=3436930 RepID=UPI003F52AF9C
MPLSGRTGQARIPESAPTPTAWLIVVVPAPPWHPTHHHGAEGSSFGVHNGKPP